MAQPQLTVRCDIHCVTAWSRYDNDFVGVPALHVIDLVRPRPEARFVMLRSFDGYTTNLPLADLADDDVLLAHRWQGKPITREHGGPMRLVLPNCTCGRAPNGSATSPSPIATAPAIGSSVAITCEAIHGRRSAMVKLLRAGLAALGLLSWHRRVPGRRRRGISPSSASTASHCLWPSTGVRLCSIVNTASQCGFTPQYKGWRSWLRNIRNADWW